MARAHGKIILAGEHAVVYGYPAIASTIPQSVIVDACESENPGFNIPLPLGEGQGEVILHRLEQMLGPRVARLQFTVKSEVPGGCGLGSSAALSVGLIRAILERFGETRTAPQVADMALQLEKIFHGNPSGVDHTAIAKEGMIWFQKGIAERIACPVKLSIVVAVSRPHGGTLQAVEAVRKRYDAETAAISCIFDAIGTLTHEMRSAIECGDVPAVGQLMNLNHDLLCQLGVSTSELNHLCEIANSNGALGAKLTGAGGGGCVIALSHHDNQLVKIFNDHGYSAFGFEI